MRTIFITSFNPFVSRNILLTDAFQQLRQQPDTRIVIFCPDYKRAYFQKQFGGPNVSIEGILTEQITRQDVVFGYLGRSLVSTKTLAIHRTEIFLRNKNFVTLIGSYFLALIGWFTLVKYLVRWFDLLTIDTKKFAHYFEQYQPTLLFSTDVFHVDDVHFLATARQRKVQTVSMVRSWDNITNKGLFRVRPEKLIVHNEVIKTEVLLYEAMPARDIAVVGLPQFDVYAQPAKRSREQFFKALGFDPKRPTFLVAPHGSRFYKEDYQLLEYLKSLPYQYIVRLPPNDTVDFQSFTPTKQFYIEHPGVNFTEGVFRDREMTTEDSVQLADELRYSDLVINYGSTIAIDAAFFDKPILVIAFDGDRTGLPYLQSVRRFLDFTHIAKMLKAGGCTAVSTKEDLVPAIDTYLKNPAMHREGRQRLAQSQIGFMDGRSGRRLAEYLLTCLPTVQN